MGKWHKMFVSNNIMNEFKFSKSFDGFLSYINEIYCSDFKKNYSSTLWKKLSAEIHKN